MSHIDDRVTLYPYVEEEMISLWGEERKERKTITLPPLLP